MNIMRIAAASLLLASMAAEAANGDVDTTFGVNGIARTGIIDGYGQSNGCKPIVQPDRKILTCGTRTTNGSTGFDFVVARFDENGTLDPSFSFDGVASIDFDNGTGSDVAGSMALQPDGRIVIVGQTHGTDAANSDFAIVRLTATGELDTDFGGGTGKALVEFDLAGGTGLDIANAVALQPDGRIVVAGSAQTGTGSAVALVRLLADGTRDSAFNLNGKVTFGFNVPSATVENDSASAVAIDGSGRIVVGATANYQLGTSDIHSEFAAARLLANGQLDANFDADGKRTIAFDPGTGLSAALCFGMNLLGNGRIVLAGYANSSASATANNDAAVVRLLPDGSNDAGFGFGGKVLVAFDLQPSGVDAAIGVTEQPNGRILLAGTSVAGPVQFGTMVRLTQAGALDQSFGVLGKKTYDFALATPDGQAFTSATLQGTQIIVNGLAYVPPGGFSSLDNIVVRLEDDTIFSDGFD